LKTFFNFIAILLFSWMQLLAQMAPKEMPIHDLEQVWITKSRTAYFTEDRKVIAFDSSSLVLHQNSSIDMLLASHASLNLKQYGSGGSLVTFSSRGTASNHTQVNWNGLPLNSITTGDIDASSIMVDMFDHLAYTPNSPGALYGSGSFGGAVELINKPDWSNSFLLKYSHESASFSSFKNALKVKMGNEFVQYQIYAFKNSALNNFTYFDAVDDVQREVKNNACIMYGVIQNLNFRLPKSIFLDAGLWLQEKNKQIPNQLGQFSSNKNQHDSLSKVFVKITKWFQHSSITLNNARLSDNMLYTDKLSPFDENYSIFSNIASHSYISDFVYKNYARKNLAFDAGASVVLKSANAAAYGTIKEEFVYSVYSSLKYTKNNNVINIGLRKDFTAAYQPNPQISMGWKRVYNKMIDSRLNISSKYRIPTFNEKYWLPYGNPNLFPEKGLGIDAGLFYISESSSLHTFSSSCNLYGQLVDNYIQWVPESSSGLYKPRNVKKIFSRGFEYDAKAVFFWNELTSSHIFQYNYCRASIIEHYDGVSYASKQLSYVPQHIVMIKNRVDYKSIYVLWEVSYKGTYFDTDDNSINPIPSLLLNNAYAGAKFKCCGLQSHIDFKVLNIENKSYYSMKSYPMPGRSYHLGISILFNNKKN